MLLVPLYLHHQLTQALQVLLLGLLFPLHLLLDHLPRESRVVVQEGQEQLADGAFGEEEVVVGEDGLLVAFDEGVVVVGELGVELLASGGQVFDLGSQLCLFHLVVLDDWLLEFSLEVVDLVVVGVAVGLVELPEVRFERLFVVPDAVHGLLQIVVVGLGSCLLTSNSIR